jgi:protein TonB
LSIASPAPAQTFGWPRDPGSGKPVVVQPVVRAPLESLIFPNDYPSAAIRANQEGNVGVRLTVSATGKVSDCAVRQSSGSQLLDSTTCSLLRRRARFVPALDAEGKPTEGHFDHIVTWKITPDTRPVINISASGPRTR